MDEKEDNTIYKVVVNHQEQYSIGPVEKPIPLGWKDTGKEGLKVDCLAYIEDIWTDMRPLSLRKKWQKIVARISNAARLNSILVCPVAASIHRDLDLSPYAD
jgi:MbtH protein